MKKAATVKHYRPRYAETERLNVHIRRGLVSKLRKRVGQRKTLTQVVEEVVERGLTRKAD